ncbi:hypothetical protein GQX74_008174 [Glossina fuscipes]|nr:hypothetical protein GQX74_008174 [Glossina fuscipes]
MCEFNGRKFYGFSMQNDPDLTTSAKNFEFKIIVWGFYENHGEKLAWLVISNQSELTSPPVKGVNRDSAKRPEMLERAIQKVNNHNKEDLKNKSKNYNNYYNNCGHTREEGGEYSLMPAEPDVDSHMTRFLNADYKRVRNLSDNEVEKLIGRAKNKPPVSPKKCRESRLPVPHAMHECHREHKDTTKTKNALLTKYKKIMREEACCQTSSEDFDACGKSTMERDYATDSVETHAYLEEYRKPKPQWVEILETSPKEPRVEMHIRDECQLVVPPCKEQFDYFSMPYQNYDAHSLPAMLMNEIVAENLRMAGTKHMNTYEESSTDNNYIVEDSDLEFEYYNRPMYTKYCKPRPPLKDDSLTASNDEGGEPHFIEVENDIDCFDMSYIRNASPIQFTEVTEETNEDAAEATELKVDINVRQKSEEQLKALPAPPPPPPDSPTTTDSKKVTTSKLQSKKRKIRSGQQQQSQARTVNSASSRPGTPVSRYCSTTPDDYSPKTKDTHSESKPNTPTAHPADKDTDETAKKKGKKGRSKNLIVSKSIEDLKAEKVVIFNKMTSTQEKIIEVLDKLRLNLLETNIPENAFDKSRRQKNAFEFSVRFSRNFLYPLKGMINDLKFTPSEQFTSLTSNDACARISNIYTLLLQSLNTYQKQLRYFLLDHVPQKLTILIEMIYTTTSACLEKNIFSTQDVVIDCLQQRCSKFIGFLEDMHEGRLNHARQNYRKLTLEKAHSKYDLKMFMNDLNMYEPKLVPKQSPEKSCSKKKSKPKKMSSDVNDVAIEQSIEHIKEKPAEDAISTQMQGLDDKKSSVSFWKIASQTYFKGNDECSPGTSGSRQPKTTAEKIDKQVIEVLQHITKEQVRQVLAPIFDSLGAALGNQVSW